VFCDKTNHVWSDDKSVIEDGDNHSDGDDAVVVTTRALPRPGITIMMLPISHNARPPDPVTWWLPHPFLSRLLPPEHLLRPPELFKVRKVI
jgi:hypothetical protein